MALVITNTQNYVDIANAIREKNGSEDTYMPSEMAAAIQAIACDEGGGKKVSNITIYESIGMYTITYDDGQIVTGSVTFDENGLPTSLTDDNGHTVNFAGGYPISATDKDGNIVPIVWG